MILWLDAAEEIVQDVATGIVYEKVEPCQQAVEVGGQVREREKHRVGHEGRSSLQVGRLSLLSKSLLSFQQLMYLAEIHCGNPSIHTSSRRLAQLNHLSHKSLPLF